MLWYNTIYYSLIISTEKVVAAAVAIVRRYRDAHLLSHYAVQKQLEMGRYTVAVWHIMQYDAMSDIGCQTL